LPEPNAYGSGVLFPVSVKGVLLDDAGVVLLENERGEWDTAHFGSIGHTGQDVLAGKLRILVEYLFHRHTRRE
jgi:hypothetical protein